MVNQEYQTKESYSMHSEQNTHVFFLYERVILTQETTQNVVETKKVSFGQHNISQLAKTVEVIAAMSTTKNNTYTHYYSLCCRYKNMTTEQTTSNY